MIMNLQRFKLDASHIGNILKIR